VLLPHVDRGGCGTRFTINLGEEKHSVFACSNDATELKKKIEEFRMVVCPAFGIYLSPELRFLQSDDAHTYMTRAFSRSLLDWTIKEIADFDRSVVART